MGLDAVVVAVVASALPAYGFWLAYRDYLRSHREFVASIGTILEKSRLTAEAIDALAPAPPVWRRPRTPR